MSKYKLFYVDSKGEKRYLQRVGIQGTGDWTTDSQDVALMRRWAEARQGMLLQIEGFVEVGREEFIDQWCEIHKKTELSYTERERMHNA